MAEQVGSAGERRLWAAIVERQDGVPTASERPTTLKGGRLSAAISKAMVGLVNDYTGRGPQKARTAVSEDMAVCLLEDTLTKGERTLVARGESEAVLDLRRRFQNAMREDAVRVVENLSGRKVKAFMSENHIDPDLAVETFVFEPVIEMWARAAEWDA
jgi:uncharacterized protein YbcI